MRMMKWLCRWIVKGLERVGRAEACRFDVCEGSTSAQVEDGDGQTE